LVLGNNFNKMQKIVLNGLCLARVPDNDIVGKEFLRDSGFTRLHLCYILARFQPRRRLLQRLNDFFKKSLLIGFLIPTRRIISSRFRSSFLKSKYVNECTK